MNPTAPSSLKSNDTERSIEMDSHPDAYVLDTFLPVFLTLMTTM